jgi:hypothetical protein
MKCYALNNESKEQIIKYFSLLYKSCKNTEIIDNKMNEIDFNSNFNNQAEIINNNTVPSNKYLEIGIEYGNCFNNTHFYNKTGVDPDPKCLITYNIKCLTSDRYFEICDIENKFDVIFIDGMHQVEYLLKDLNNSMNHLNVGGTIFIDDILPANYNEQLKIPRNHYYENGILKYGEPGWTGDIWKVIYYILKKYNDNIIDFQLFNNVNYRGVCKFKLIKTFEILNTDIDIINSYDYYNDFNDYIDIIKIKLKIFKH